MTGHVAFRRWCKTNVCRILGGNLEERGNLGDLGIDGSYQSGSQRQDGRVCGLG